MTILGPTNLPATVPYHASQMYARNVVTLIQHLVQRRKGRRTAKPPARPTLVLNMADEITQGNRRHEGRRTIVHPRRARETSAVGVRADMPGWILQSEGGEPGD